MSKGCIGLSVRQLSRGDVTFMLVCVIGFGLFQGARILDLDSGPYSPAPYAPLGTGTGGLAYLFVALVAYSGRLESSRVLFPTGACCSVVSIVVSALFQSDAALVLSQALSGVGWALVNLCWMQVFSYARPSHAILLVSFGYAVDALAVLVVLGLAPVHREACFLACLVCSWLALVACIARSDSFARQMAQDEDVPSASGSTFAHLSRAIVGVSMFALLCGFIVQRDILMGIQYGQGSLASLLCLAVSLAFSVVFCILRPKRVDMDVAYPLLVAALASVLLARFFAPGGDLSIYGSVMVAMLVTFFSLLWMMFVGEAHARRLPALFLLGLPVSAAQLSIAAGRLLARGLSGSGVEIGREGFLALALWMLVVMACVLYAMKTGSLLLRDRAGHGVAGQKDGLPPVEPEAGVESVGIPAAMSDVECVTAALRAAHGLSQREAEIVAEYSSGRSARYIADQNMISEHTVKTHLRRAYAKMNIHSRQELLDLVERAHACGEGRPAGEIAPRDSRP